MMQMEAQTKSAACEARYWQMARSPRDLEDAYEDLKERIEQMTVNPQLDMGPAVDLQVEVAAFCKILKGQCDIGHDDAHGLRHRMKNEMNDHLQYVMIIRDEFIAFKTALMQIIQNASN